MFQFCTAFDSHYLFKGLALYHSLARHAPGSVLWVLCYDEETQRVLECLAYPGLRVLPLRELEAAEPRLAAARQDRSRVEYYFTCTPALVWHLLARLEGTGSMTYLDADLWFFANPAPLFAEAGSSSVTILGHRFAPAFRHLETYGVYNVSWLTFATDDAARECLAWWRDRCLEWCYDRLENDRYADQKYLDDWPTRFRNVHVLEDRGAGVAPWNLAAYPISVADGRVLAGGAPLVFFHFHSFKRVTRWLFDPGLARYGAEMTPALREGVYLPYLEELRAIERALRRDLPQVPRGWGSARGLGLPMLLRQALRGQLLVAR